MRIADLLTAEELGLLGLVQLPVPLNEFLASSIGSRQALNQLLYSLFAAIPGAEVGPIAGDYTWASPYADYPAWLAWFIAHRTPVARRVRDAELARSLNQSIMARAGHADLPQAPDRPHVWAPWQNRHAGVAQEPRSQLEMTLDTPENPLLGRKGVIVEYEPGVRPRPRPTSRNPLERFMR